MKIKMSNNCATCKCDIKYGKTWCSDCFEKKQEKWNKEIEDYKNKENSKKIIQKNSR